MPRTRSKPAPKESTPPPATSNARPLPPGVENASKLFVLPKDTPKDARIVTLDNPANGVPSRYLFCVGKGFYEFTRIAAPKKACKSWLITSDQSKRGKGETPREDEASTGSGYITKSADLFAATPIDLLFLTLPALAPRSAKDTKQLFLSLDDYLDRLSASSLHFKILLSQYPSLRTMVAKRLDAFCDTVDAGDETMYRLSNEKLLQCLLKKAERICVKDFPASMEDKFVKERLVVPIMSIKREESGISTASTTEPPAAEDSQDSVTSSTALDSQTSTDTATTAATSVDNVEEAGDPAIVTPPEVPHLLRLRTVLTYMLKSYVPSTLHHPLNTLLDTPINTLPNFTLLDTHLASLSKLKAEANALRAISDNISRKRALEDDEEKIAEREEKKRKKEEEEKRKKNESRGVKQLKKADTSGMKKLSAFFGKAPAKKA